MHGLVHQTLKTYVVEKTDEASWEVVLERSGIDARLYLPVSHYPDEEIATILETVARLSGHEVEAVERDFGRTLAPALLQNFRAHWRDDWSLLDLLETLEEIAAALAAKSAENRPPTVTCESTESSLRVTYRSHRDHPAMAHGILEGLAREFEADATVTRVESERTDEETRAVFRLDGDGLE